MSSSRHSLRAQVAAQARHRCGYCLTQEVVSGVHAITFPQSVSFMSLQVIDRDHDRAHAFFGFDPEMRLRRLPH